VARILVVDDVAMNRELIHAYLDATGHELVDAESGEHALAVAERSPPDLVLLDVMMPGMNGFETTQRLKAGSGDLFLPIILLTSLSDSASRLLGLQMGADEFLTKPVDRQELSVRVRNLLALRAKDTALRERNVALAELNRFKDEMSALIIHDLKNPLSVIQSNLDYVLEQLHDIDSECMEALVDSRMAGRRLIRLLSNLYDLAQLEGSRLELRRSPTNVVQLLHDITQQRRVLAQSRHITLEVADAPAPKLQADGDLLARAVENIIDNSLRHTPREGRIELSVKDAGSDVQIRIGNTGPAVPAEVRGVIFEKFGQVLPGIGRMNLGLGLYFCRLAMEAHGGRIWVEETAALPTMFVMQLPA
jgi:two-component system, sensor histidine kinase and response regulator